MAFSLSDCKSKMLAERSVLVICAVFSNVVFVSVFARDVLEESEDFSLRQMVQDLRTFIIKQEQRLSVLEKRCEFLDELDRIRSNEVNGLHEMIKKQNEMISRLNKGQSVCVENIANITRMFEMYRGSFRGKPSVDSDRFTGRVNHRKERTLIQQPKATENTIAFYAYSTHPFPNPNSLFVLTFDTVIANVGNGYHHHSGVFIAPRTGVYVFTWSFRIQNEARISTELVVNDSAKSAVYLDVMEQVGGNESGTVVTHVNQGDDVFVRVAMSINEGSILSDSIGRTYFGGWILA